MSRLDSIQRAVVSAIANMSGMYPMAEFEYNVDRMMAMAGHRSKSEILEVVFSKFSWIAECTRCGSVEPLYGGITVDDQFLCECCCANPDPDLNYVYPTEEVLPHTYLVEHCCGGPNASGGGCGSWYVSSIRESEEGDEFIDRLSPDSERTMYPEYSRDNWENADANTAIFGGYWVCSSCRIVEW